MASPDDQQRAARIITHMNSQHRRELSHYLRHHHALSSRKASPAALTAITLTSMTITDADGNSHVVTIDPPLKTWADARTRLADMDAESRKHLGLSDVTLETYQLPRPGVEVFVCASVVFYFICYAAAPSVVPGTRAWAFLDQVFPPNGASSWRWLTKTIFWPVMGIHAFEAVLLDIKRMQPYGVDRFSKLWWMWEVSCFIEGFGSFRRTKAIVDAKREEKDKASKAH